MNRSRLTQLIGIGLCIAMITAAAFRAPIINAGRGELNKMGSTAAVAQAPPEYALFIQAFGAFRSLIVNIAFIRAEELKEQGRYYDAMQLARWICNLQPHFPSVWEFASWNMAWNISVTTFTAEERWNWVYNGVKLLRDEGIQLNPRAVNLYKQLAWTFNNKMSEPTDDYHMAYKANWAWRMHLVVGPPPKPEEDLDPNLLATLETVEKTEDFLADAARRAWEQNEEKRRVQALDRRQTYEKRRWEDLPARERESGATVRAELKKRAILDELEAIAAAPATFEALVEAHPDIARMRDELVAIGIFLPTGRLTEDEYWRDRGLAFTFFEPYRRLVDPENLIFHVVSELASAEDPLTQQAQAIDRILGVTQGNEAGAALVHYLQKRVLVDVYKMQPEQMVEVVELFGPVDWRSVDAASLYWVATGLAATGESPNDFRSDKLNTARILFFSLRNLFLRNRITFEPYPPRIHDSYLNFARDLDFVEPMHQAFLNYGWALDPRAGDPNETGAGDAFRVAHFNFLSEAIRMLYLEGREGEAEFYFRYLQENYPLTEQNTPNPGVMKTLREFVLDNFMDTTAGVMGPREARATVDALLTYSLTVLAEGETTRYASLVRRAREIYDSFMADKNLWMLDPKRLPPFGDMQVDAVRNFMGVVSTTASQTLRKARLWRALPSYLRLEVFEEVLPWMKIESDRWGFDVARAFPEPEGFAEWRAANPQRMRTAPLDPNQPPTEVQTLPPKFGGD